MRERVADRAARRLRQFERRPLPGVAIVAGAIIVTLLLSGCMRESIPLTPADLEDIRSADRAYAEAWLANDSSAVMATLSSDPVIVPSGMPALEGADAIRDFWWPADAPPATVRQFDLTQHEAGGQGGVGFVRGSFLLAFEYADQDYASAGEYLSVLERISDGSWRISHRMWSDRPVEAQD